MKQDYSTAFNKRFIQDIAFSLTNKSTITALPGPNLNLYTSILTSKGFKKMIFYENDIKIFVGQMFNIPKNVNYTMDNILNHLKNDSYYDLDFCCTVKSVESHLKEINNIDEYSMTLSLGRGVGVTESYTLETLKNFENDGIYKYMKYRDTVPMLTIIKTQKR